jgi:hypothetical protein
VKASDPMTTDQDVKRILDEHADALSALPNVVGMGVVEDAGRAAIAVYVSEKIPAAELEESELVPRELEANGLKVRTQVIEVGEIKLG